MTEQQNRSVMVEETRETVEAMPQPENNDKRKAGNRTSLALSAIAIVIATVVGIGLYGLNKQQATRQNVTIFELSGQLVTLQKAQESQKSELEDIIRQQADQLSQVKHEQGTLTKQLDESQQGVAVTSGSGAKTWPLAQTDFLVKLVGRKLQSDRDVTTVVALLKGADTSLADMNDLSLVDVHRVITDDVVTLFAVNQVDYDGMILKVNQLTDQIDNLRLADNNGDSPPMDSDSDEFSSSISEWRANLQKSWQNLMSSLITAYCRDGTAVPLLAPNQNIYLRKNIHSRLLVATQVVPRHQEETRKQSPDNVSVWVRAYYGADDTTTKTSPDEVDKLSQQSITMTVSEVLQSQALLEKLIQIRMRNLMAQPVVTVGGAPSPAPAAPVAPVALQGE